MTTRSEVRAEIEESLERHPDAPYARRIRHMGVEREIDWDMILAANTRLVYDVDLRRYPTHPEVKEAVQRARDALAELVDVFNTEIAQPAWRAYQVEEYRRQQEDEPGS